MKKYGGRAKKKLLPKVPPPPPLPRVPAACTRWAAAAARLTHGVPDGLVRQLSPHGCCSSPLDCQRCCLVLQPPMHCHTALRTACLAVSGHFFDHLR